MNIDHLRDNIIERSKQTPDDHACLVGISGIDAGGKGYIARQLLAELEGRGRRVALINVDAWLNLPHVRFSDHKPGEHFYYHVLRLDEMFEQLVLPLKKHREIHITTDFAEETATSFHSHAYAFENIDIILLEGIFIFKRAFASLFDLKIWIQCSFETALNRAIERRQENLSMEATIEAYESIYFPAQRFHFEMDDPRGAADLIVVNEEKNGVEMLT
jgi:uridine kinase